jgi:hypothetical protein
MIVHLRDAEHGLTMSSMSDGQTREAATPPGRLARLRARLPLQNVPARWLLAAAVVVHVVLVVWAFHTVRFDDAFIVYRYGQNLAQGRGLAFNPGEHLWGSTTVLGVLISALVHALVGHEATPSAMAGLGCLGWTAQCGLVYLLLHPLGRWPRLMPALALAVGGAGSFCWVGLETNLAMALGLGALYAAFHERWRGGFVLAACAVLARPDQAVVLLLVSGLAWRAMGVRSLRAAIPGAALLAAWYVSQAAWFGVVASKSMTAKFALSSFWVYARHEFSQVPAELLALVSGDRAPFEGSLAGLLVWPVVAYGGVWLARAGRHGWVLPMWLAAHLLGYLTWRPLTSAWHLYPAVVIATVLFWLGLGALARRVANSRLSTLLVRLVAVTLLALSCLRTLGFALHGQHASFWFGGRHRVYEEIGRELARQAGAEDACAAGEVGTLAYYSGIPVHEKARDADPRRPPPAAR